MKNYLFPLFLSLLFNCCTSGEKEESRTLMIDPGKIQPGEVINDSLSATQLEKIKQIQSTFAEVYPASLNETITNFKRDANPDHEIAIWLNMADAYQKYLTATKTALTLDKRKEVFKLILLRSMMSSEEAIPNSKLKFLTNAEAEEVLSFYSNEPKPIDIIKK